MTDEFLALVGARTGHFLYESGYHGELWLDLERLCYRPEQLTPLLRALVERVRPYAPEIVCAPLIEGAFIGLMAAQELGCGFVYANRIADEPSSGLFPVRYRLPESLQQLVRGRRVAIVNDVISAGSAVRGTYADLERLQAEVVVVASLMVMGDGFAAFAREKALPVERLAEMSLEMWRPDECPLCRKGVELERLAGA